MKDEIESPNCARISRRRLLCGVLPARLLAGVSGEELERLVHQRTEARLAGNREAYRKLTLRCYTWNGSSEPQARADGGFEGTFEISEFRVEYVNDGVAVVRYCYTEYVSREEGSPYMRMPVREVWVKQAGCWKALSGEIVRRDQSVPNRTETRIAQAKTAR